MGGKSASLLTKTQRTRIRDGFASLDEEKTRRDEQRIRDRLRAGLFDCELLVDYPDRQLELAFDDVPEDDLRTGLADATLIVERVRELHGFARDDVVVRARQRAETRVADSSDVGPGDVDSLARLDLRTRAEIRNDAAAAVREDFEPNRWDRRADALLKLAASSVVPLLGIAVAAWATGRDLLGTNAAVDMLYVASFMVLMVSLSGVLLIKAAQVLKYTVVPSVVALRRDPAGAARGALGWLRRPGETLRRTWDEL